MNIYMNILFKKTGPKDTVEFSVEDVSGFKSTACSRAASQQGLVLPFEG